MTTDQRIDRFKSQMIEMSQKLDQLLEGWAKILAVFTRPDQTMDIAVESLANMSTKTDNLGDRENG